MTHIISVVNPSAQITKLLHSNGQPEEPTTGKGYALESNRAILGNYYFLFCLMESSGCRISELLNASFEQVTSSGKILIKGAKGSHDRFISDPRATAFLIKRKAAQLKPFIGMNRFTARRMLQKISLFTLKHGRKNLTMTGVFRELYASQVREIENSDSAVSKFIGHKSKSNGAHYGKG